MRFPHCGKFSLLCLVSLLKVYFIVKAVFFKCLLRKKKTILTFQPPTRFLCENLSHRQAQLAPTPLNSSSREAAWEGRQRADAGNKVERKRKTRRKRAGSENWRPGSVHSQLRPSAQWEAGSGGHRTASRSAPGHWLSEGRPEAKGVPTVPPAHHLPSIPTDGSLNKQLFGKYK